MMPDGVALRDVGDDCMALYRALVDLSTTIMLTWSPMRQPIVGHGGRATACGGAAAMSEPSRPNAVRGERDVRR